MKFLCIQCDEQMETQKDGLFNETNRSISLSFKCKKCGYAIAMLTNRFETEFVSKLGVEMGGESEVGSGPMSMVGSTLAQGKEELKQSDPPVGEVEWTQGAKDRMAKVPFFVRGMAKKTVIDFAKERGVRVIDEALMDEVREKVGM